MDFLKAMIKSLIFPNQIASPVAIGGCVVGGVYPDHGTLEEIYQVCCIARIQGKLLVITH